MAAHEYTVDVLIPCFNADRYIGAAIDSVLEQDWPPARVIVVDDGSTDSSADVIRSYGPPVEYHRQANGGISSARNAAAARATADHLAFLDADDLWTRRSLAVRVEHLASNPELDGVFGALVQFISPELEASLSGRYQLQRDPAVARFAGTLVVKRDAFGRAGTFDVTLRTGEMIAWLAHAEAAGVRLGTLPEVVLQRRIHDANTVLRAGDTRTDYLQAIRNSLALRRAAHKDKG